MSGGLQVKQLNNEWLDAIPIENTFVINLGDAIEHNTGGLLRATPHR
jgi:isopenicillin N synthase-like dioxygenase